MLCQNSVEYLGVKLDSKLTFNQHTIESTTKARRIRAALYPSVKHNSPVPIQGKIAIVKMCVNTILRRTPVQPGEHWFPITRGRNSKRYRTSSFEPSQQHERGTLEMTYYADR